MKILVVSDVHANLDALDAVLAADGDGTGGFLCLGDLTGYGPDPEETCARVLGFASSRPGSVVLKGNHDAALTGELETTWFSDAARLSVTLTARVVSPDTRACLASLPSLATVTWDPRVLACHGSPAERLTGYLFGGEETSRALDGLRRDGYRALFCGHTHESAVYGLPGGRVFPRSRDTVSLQGPVAIINPGSVGFPRAFNGEPLEDYARWPAYYCVWDTDRDEVEFREARYDFSRVVDRMRAGGWAT
jgi:diadenosine tetraphosphatase ApaH/serine/threonine PP2A family protein phosphatase